MNTKIRIQVVAQYSFRALCARALHPSHEWLTITHKFSYPLYLPVEQAQ